jgi:hypothetical protein
VCPLMLELDGGLHRGIRLDILPSPQSVSK